MKLNYENRICPPVYGFHKSVGIVQVCIRFLQHTGAEARCRLIAVNRQILADFRAVIV